jgi:ubiquinol-cytochrome c reductase cytochrome c1 subunit
MFRKIAITAVSALCVLTGAARAEGGSFSAPDVAFSFDGPFGSYDRNQLQRGLQVFTEVCSACHGLKYVPLRTLGDRGGPELPEDQVRAYAAELTVVDAETGEDRAALPADQFPANTAAGAPDLSLMAKARAGFHGPFGFGIGALFRGKGGAEHIVAILTSYTGETKDIAGVTLYENHAFPTGWISMSPPLEDGLVTFADGAPNDVQHVSEDVAAFLQWTAEPKLDARKATGFKAVIFLGMLSVLLYLTNKRLWAGIKGKKHTA